MKWMKEAISRYDYPFSVVLWNGDLWRFVFLFSENFQKILLWLFCILSVGWRVACFDVFDRFEMMQEIILSNLIWLFFHSLGYRLFFNLIFFYIYILWYPEKLNNSDYFFIKKIISNSVNVNTYIWNQI